MKSDEDVYSLLSELMGMSDTRSLLATLAGSLNERSTLRCFGLLLWKQRISSMETLVWNKDQNRITTYVNELSSHHVNGETNHYHSFHPFLLREHKVDQPLSDVIQQELHEEEDALVFPLGDADGNTDFFWIVLEMPGIYPLDHWITLIKPYSTMLRVALAQVRLKENQHHKSTEHQTLLSLSTAIAGIHDASDLHIVLRDHLRKILPDIDVTIGVFNENKTMFRVVAAYVGEGRSSHQDFNAIAFNEFPVMDGIHNEVLVTKEPVFLYIEDLMKNPFKHAGIQFIHDTGIKDIAAMRLVNNNQDIGFITLLSEQRGVFSKPDPFFFKGIAGQFSVALANVLAMESLKVQETQTAALLSLSNALSEVQSKNDLKVVINGLSSLIPFDALVIQINAEREDFHQRFISLPDTNDDSSVLYPIEDGCYNKCIEVEDAVVFDMSQWSQLNQIPDYLQRENIHFERGIGVALKGGEKTLGVLFILLAHKRIISQDALRVLQGVACQISITLAKLIALQKIQEREREKSMLLSLSSDFSKIQSRKDLHSVIDVKLKSIFHFSGFAVGLILEDGLHHNAYLFNCEDYDANTLIFDTTASLKYEINDGLFNYLIERKEPVRIIIDELEHLPPYVQLWKSFRAKSFIAVPLHVANKCIGCLYLAFENADNNIPYRNLLIGICDQLGMSISNIVSMEKIRLQLEQINQYKEQLEEERIYLQSEVSRPYDFNDIIGESQAMKKVFQLLSQVSATESTTLILGETGTGKELIARAIHNRSTRKDNLMVKLNCSAIPANLIESELFGHEKGSFTGAIERRIGKFELANNGTLFLDEIGEMPIDMQAKLLRALQEREIERVGGRVTIKVNVRIIAATNRNLLQEVAAGKFRSDLYYRLNVFPILLPPLRERSEDIPVLVAYFMNKLSKKTGKVISKISEKAMTTLMHYSWPGNIRELEHLIERSMLIAKGEIIREIPMLIDVAADKSTSEPETIKTLDQAERDYIIRVLNLCNGKVSGPAGAAELLGVKRSTLVSKMSKLGITYYKTFNK